MFLSFPDSVPEPSNSTPTPNSHGGYNCSVCAREFSGVNSLRKHAPIHTRKVQHACDLCGHVFGKRDYLRDHLAKHSAADFVVSEAPCEVCNTPFPKTVKLKEHMKAHRNYHADGVTIHSVLPFRCHICREVFQQARVLHSHLVNAHHHAEPQRPDVRQTLNKVFGRDFSENNFSSADLVALAAQQPPLPVNGVGAAPPQQPHHPFLNGSVGKLLQAQPIKIGNVSVGRVSHNSGLSPFGQPMPQPMTPETTPKKRRPGPASRTNAPEENRVSSTNIPSYLDSSEFHGERSQETYPCGECGKVLQHKQSWVSHMRVIHGNYFGGNKWKGSSVVDMILEESVKMSPKKKAPKGSPEANACMCSVCEQVFPNPSSLRNHVVNVHVNGQSHTCDLCGKAFLSQENLDTHTRAKHPNLNKRLQSLRDALGLKDQEALSKSLSLSSGISPSLGDSSDVDDALSTAPAAEATEEAEVDDDEPHVDVVTHDDSDSNEPLSLVVAKNERSRSPIVDVATDLSRKPLPVSAGVVGISASGPSAFPGSSLPSTSVLSSSFVLSKPSPSFLKLSHVASSALLSHSSSDFNNNNSSKPSQAIVVGFPSAPLSKPFDPAVIKPLPSPAAAAAPTPPAPTPTDINNNSSEGEGNILVIPPPAGSESSGNRKKNSICKVCGVVLSPKTNVNVHMRTHSGARPYQCVLCLNRFRQKAHLMKHFRCSHNQKKPPFVCLFCPDECASSNDLYRHITDKHKAETDELIKVNGLTPPSTEEEIKIEVEPSFPEIHSQPPPPTPPHHQQQQQSHITIQQPIELPREPLAPHAVFVPPTLHAEPALPVQPVHEPSIEVKEPEAEEHIDVVSTDEAPAEEDIRYEPITEPFLFENMIIHPCYVVLPFVSDSEVQAYTSSEAKPVGVSLKLNV